MACFQDHQAISWSNVDIILQKGPQFNFVGDILFIYPQNIHANYIFNMNVIFAAFNELT